MKSFLTSGLVFSLMAVFAQSVPIQKPIEEQYHVSYWWWTIGVLLAIGAGIGLYMLLKKDPRRDAD
jgi:hypothetical protein